MYICPGESHALFIKTITYNKKKGIKSFSVDYLNPNHAPKWNLDSSSTGIFNGKFWIPQY